MFMGPSLKARKDAFEVLMGSKGGGSHLKTPGKRPKRLSNPLKDSHFCSFVGKSGEKVAKEFNTPKNSRHENGREDGM